MNIEIIDKWLNEEYGVSYTNLEELHNRQVDKIQELDKKYTQALEIAQDRFERIQKAIELIENCNHGTEEYKIYEIATTEVEELLDILKGE